MKETIRKEYNILISVDENILRSEREYDKPFSLKEAIIREFDWLHESGIYLEKIKNLRTK